MGSRGIKEQRIVAENCKAHFCHHSGGGASGGMGRGIIVVNSTQGNKRERKTEGKNNGRQHRDGETQNVSVRHESTK